MPTPIRFSDVEVAADPWGYRSGSAAVQLVEPAVTLRCRVLAADPVSLEALRYARRAMLREEWTRGSETGDPSLGDAVFSPNEVTWKLRVEDAERGREKLAELLDRANRARAELDARSDATP